MAAWLASFTRLASCSWRSASNRCASASRERPVWSATNSRNRPKAPAASSSSDKAPTASAALPSAVSSARPCCSRSRPWRKGSLSASSAVCAWCACTRPGRLARIAPPSLRIGSYCASNCRSGSRAAPSRVPGSRNSGLPSLRPSASPRNRSRSSPSCLPAAPLTPSAVSTWLALLPMRCVSITSWPAADSSAAEAPPCAFSENTASALPSQVADWRLTAFSAAAKRISAGCCASTWAALFSARSTNGTSASSCACRSAGTALASVFRPRTLPASTSLLSRTSANAAAWPSKACDADLASRCDCIVACPTDAACSAPRPLAVNASAAVSSSPARPRPKTMNSARCWRANGQPPSTGRPLGKTSSALRVPAWRDSAKSAASSEGAAWEMIDESSSPARSPGISVRWPRRTVRSMGLSGGSSSSKCDAAALAAAGGAGSRPLILSRKLMSSSSCLRGGSVSATPAAPAAAWPRRLHGCHAAIARNGS
jgi:hypothetical protein